MESLFRSPERSVMEQVCDGYERRVLAVLDHWLPPHTDECDEGNTQRACPRCDVLAHMQVAFGFARPLTAQSDAVLAYCSRLDDGDCDDTDKCRAYGCRWIENGDA